jgi:hypothetical protein
MNAFSVLSVVFAVIALAVIVAAIVIDEGLMVVAWPVAVIAVYLDHHGIEQSFRDFHARERSKP